MSNEQANISIASKTDTGRRPANEDSCLALTSDDLGGRLDALMIVADGMGGRASGQVASDLAVKAVRDSIVSDLASDMRDLSAVLSRSLQAANSAVYREANAKPGLSGMGTTCVVAAVQGGKVCYAHLGDSRAYLLHDRQLLRLTEDHSFVAEKVKAGEITEEQARTSRFRNIITRAVGLDAEALPEVGSTDLRAGDVLLLCTDGLSGPVTDVEIADILSTSSDVEEACADLVRTALRNGGTDNVTTVVMAYSRPARPVTVVPVGGQKRGGAWLLPALIGLMIGLGIGLSPVRDLVLPPAKAPARPKPPQVSLAGLTYGEPVSLYFPPVQDGILSLDQRGYLQVADLQGRLIRLDSSGRVVRRFPERSTLKPPLQTPSARIAVDRQNNLYISDPRAKRILKYGQDDLLLASIGEGKLILPAALAVGRDGSIYVIDNGRLKAIRPVQPPVADHQPSTINHQP